LFAAIFFCSKPGICQQATILHNLVIATETKDSEKRLIESVIKHTESLKKKNNLSEIKFLRKVFYQTHHKFLKEYQPYSALDNLVLDGKYDCLTATALYSSVFEILGFDFKIIETNYHIFIIAKASGKDVLIETTDGFKGLIAGEEAINKRIGEYKNNEPSIANENSKGLYFNFHLLNEVKGNELSGLLYYNKAVKEFNKHNWDSCQAFLVKSREIHDSPRIDQIHELLSSIVAREGNKTMSHSLSSITLIKETSPISAANGN